MRFALEHEHIIFKIWRWSWAPEIKPLGQISSSRHSDYLESVLLLQSYTGANETIVCLFVYLKFLLENINQYKGSGATFSDASINQE